ncbi:MAG: S-layer family protein, partial [Microcystaceae cyanobacterium]
TLQGRDSGLFANTAPNSTGDGGNIFIDPRTVNIRDGAGISVTSRGIGKAGNIQLQTGSLTLENGAFLSAETASSEGGNIQLQVRDLLLMRHNSKISTTAGTASAGGNGGNIKINTGFLIAVPNENSDITANAFEGRGGNIQITTQGIFGIQLRERQTSLSDITASSDFGVNGIVEINTPDIDPSRGLVELPEKTVDVAGLVAQGCPADVGPRASKFVITGRGGLPENPSQPLSGDAVQVDLVEPAPVGSRGANPAPGAEDRTNAKSSVPTTIVEAQGWAMNDKGQVILTAYKSNGTVPQRSGQNPAPCPALVK